MAYEHLQESLLEQKEILNNIKIILNKERTLSLYSMIFYSLCLIVFITCNVETLIPASFCMWAFIIISYLHKRRLRKARLSLEEQFRELELQLLEHE